MKFNIIKLYILFLFIFFISCRADKPIEPVSIISEIETKEILKYIQSTLSDKFLFNTSIQYFSSKELLEKMKNSHNNYDVIISSNFYDLSILSKKEIISGNSIKKFFKDNLIIIYNKNINIKTYKLKHFLNSINSVAILGPFTFSSGRAARKLLINSGMIKKIQDKIIIKNNINDIFNMLKSNKLDCAILLKSQLLNKQYDFKQFYINENFTPEIIYYIARINKKEKNPLVTDFLDYLNSYEITNIFRKLAIELY